MSDLTAAIRRIGLFLERDIRLALSYRLNVLLQAGAWLFTLFMWYFIATLMDKGTAAFASTGGYFPYVIFGLALQGMLTTVLYSASSRIREQQMNGTLEYTLNLLRWPCEMPALSMASDFLAGVLRLYLLLLAARLLFDITLPDLGVVNFVLPLLFCSIAFGAIGNLAAASVLLFKRGEPVSYFFGTASALFGTVFFPKEVLPTALRSVSDLIPTTHALAVLRGSIMEGKGIAELAGSYLYLLVFSTVLVPLSLWLFNAAVRRAKRDGSLGQY